MSEIIQLSFTKSSPTIVISSPTPESINIPFSQVITPETGSGGTTYPWTQSIPLAVWTIPHNLNKFPSVTVVDDLNNKIEPDIKYLDNNNVQITHGIALAGKAYLN